MFAGCAGLIEFRAGNAAEAMATAWTSIGPGRREIARLRAIPVIGVGGIATLDDAMEFLVAGASAVQIGTANFYDPTASVRIVDALPSALASLGAERVSDVVGTLIL